MDEYGPIQNTNSLSFLAGGCIQCKVRESLDYLILLCMVLASNFFLKWQLIKSYVDYMA